MTGRHFLKIHTLMLFAFMALQFQSCKDKQASSEVESVNITFKKEGEIQLKKATSDSLLAVLDIEIADDAYTTQTGLMYRSSLDINQGMLFVFPDSDFRSFYMKNTEIPLDIIYISENKTVVSIQKNTKPMSEISLPSDGPAKYVLEVNAGLSDIWTLEQGDLIEFSMH